VQLHTLESTHAQRPETHDEFRELLDAKGATGVPSACPACGKSPWFGGLSNVFELPVRPPGKPAPTGGAADLQLEIIAPTCGRCGYMMIFDRKLLVA
jgi:ribosomal protein S27AE